MKTTESAAGRPRSVPGLSLSTYSILVATGAFATTFAQQRVLAKYPTTFLLKDHLHLGKEQVAVFFFWATFAWNIKPLAGILTDAFPLFGTRRRSYMALGSIGAALCWLTMALFPSDYRMLLGTCVAMNVATVLASTVMGGLMVEAGHTFGVSGRISALRQVVQSIAGICAPLIGGYFAGSLLGWTKTTVVGAASVAALAVITLIYLREPRTARSEPLQAFAPRQSVSPVVWIGIIAASATVLHLLRLGEEMRTIAISLFALLAVFILIVLLTIVPTRNAVLAKAQDQLSQILRSGTLWMASAMLLLIYTVPGLETALTFRQADVLHFTPAFIGRLSAIEGIAGVVGAALYMTLCRRAPLRWLIVLSVGFHAALTLLYLVYTRATAIPVHTALGFIVVLSELALMDLAVRSTPKGCEALGFALMMSVRNFGQSLSDVLGSKLIDTYKMPFSKLVYVNAGTTAAVLLFVFFLPRAIVGLREGGSRAMPAAPTPGEERAAV